MPLYIIKGCTENPVFCAVFSPFPCFWLLGLYSCNNIDKLTQLDVFIFLVSLVDRSSMLKPSFIIVDNQPLFVEALMSILVEEFSVESVCHFDNAHDAYASLLKKQVDIVLVDIELNQSNGFDLIKRVNTRKWVKNVLFISSKPYDSYSSVARSLGAQGYVTKSEPRNIIVNAIRNILAGYTYFKEESTAELANVALSKRELSVLTYLSQGYNNKQVSKLLSLSEKTISTYKSRILKKYNAASIMHIVNSNRLFTQNLID